MTNAEKYINSNPGNVSVGQVWRDLDNDHRLIRVVEIADGSVRVENVAHYLNSLVGRRTSISLDRFHINTRGFIMEARR
jgi:hypothetical protein